jgi:HK97 family phage prohead protease
MKKIISYLDFAGTKSLQAVKDIDEKRMIVTGYFGAFNNVDLGKDVLSPSSATRTINARGPQGSNDIFFLRQHDTGALLGKPNVLKADDYGIYHESPISNTTLGKDTAILIRDKVLNKFSIGYRTVKEEQVGDVNYLKEIFLYEGSVVTFPMNEGAILTGFKSIDAAKEQIETLENYCRNTTVSDDTVKLLFLHIKQLQQTVIDLQHSTHPVKTTAPDRSRNDKRYARHIKNIINELNY